MPINPDAIGTSTDPVPRTWDSKDCLLYALGVGIGANDPLEQLEFTTENTSGVHQRVLPTMAVVLTGRASQVIDALGPFDRTKLVHGEQSIEIQRPIPVEGSLSTVSTIVGIYDKGSGAIVVIESVSVEEPTGAPLFTTRSTLFIRGEGGWGGDRGPSTAVRTPETAPDLAVDLPTRKDQALLYRLSGDRNPLHSDPRFASRGGFPRPILHGLCTYGFTGQALLREVCEGDPRRFHGMSCRFSAPVFPGERLSVDMWRLEPALTAFRTRVDDRVVIDGGRLRHSGG